MADFSNITIVAVLDNNGELHKIDFEQLANRPQSMKNPHALIIFGQRYDGSNEVTVTPSIATTSSAGCVKPVAKTSSMTQDVGIDNAGKLYTKGVQVDSTVTAFSENAVSGNGVYQYGNNLVTQMQSLVNTTKQNIDKEQAAERKKITDSLDTTNTTVEQLKTSVKTNTDDISALKTSVNQAKQDISSNSSEITKVKQKNESQDTEISGIKTDITNQVKALNDTITKTKNDIEADVTTQVSAVDTKADNNATSIAALQNDLRTANSNISTNKDNIATNKSDISSLKTRCTNIEKDVFTNKSSIESIKSDVAQNLASIQVNASGIAELDGKLTSQQVQLTTLLARSIGGFFDSESALLLWVRNPNNTKNLEVGAGLFVNNDTSFYYIWNGTSAVKFVFLSDVTGGYLPVIDPKGTGQFTMNDCVAGSYGGAIGTANTIQQIYGFASGQGLIVSVNGGLAFGEYNETPDDDEIFSVGQGVSDTDRKTVISMSVGGTQNNGGDVVAYSDKHTLGVTCDVSKSSFRYSIAKVDDSIDLAIDYDVFYNHVVPKDDATYVITYANNVWQSDDIIDRAIYSNLSELGITFKYRDGTSGIPSVTFTNGDTITIYAPPQGQISMRDMYTAFSKLHLYVDEDGDICQED